MPVPPKRPKIAAILGPTATGKSRIAVEVAPAIMAEIVSVDSMQVYRGMDIGTAKPGEPWTDLVPHHMLDVVEASREFSAAQFQEKARRAIEEINARGRTALLVGGTGLYFEAVVYDISFPPGSADDELRRRLQQEAVQDLAGLKERLAAVDPVFASCHDFANPRRVVRAMEVYERTGVPFSSFQSRRGMQSSFYEFSGVALNAPRQALYGAIDARVDAMFAAGLVEEVRSLAATSGLSRTARQALGYKEVLDHLDRGIPLEETIGNVKRRSRNYAKRQLTWLRRIPGLYWLDLDEADLAEPSPWVIAAVLDHLRAGL
ncbi:MAG: tRNA (adenosine(37)-N6)-dimethylallyltransferase MiaA [Actinomycetota bacterium]